MRFAKQVGGYQIVITVLQELAEKLDAQKLLEVSMLEQDLSLTQRLGYLLTLLGHKKLCQALKKRISTHSIQAVALVPDRALQKKDFKTDPVWKVVINEDLETDL